MEYITISGKVRLNDKVLITDLSKISNQLMKFDENHWELDPASNVLEIKAETQGEFQNVLSLLEVIRKVKSSESSVLLNRDTKYWTSDITLLAFPEIRKQLTCDGDLCRELKVRHQTV